MPQYLASALNCGRQAAGPVIRQEEFNLGLRYHHPRLEAEGETAVETRQ
jgi:hypothetical protein